MEQRSAAQYDPATVEDATRAGWEAGGVFAAAPASGKKPYVVVIPPPNVTGVLHMGHALNNTFQDILVRWKRMGGCDALWVPGTDHAGIATQNVVEKELAKRKTSRRDIGREAFLAEVWGWKEKHGSRIIEQLRRLGASCDWSRERFTMDEGLSRAVVTAFVALYNEGLIYRGRRIIHWCPRCTTALSDEEVEYRDREGSLYVLRYPVEGGGAVEVATTRPETMLGDTAVAVHPDDGRYRSMVGRKVLLPFVNRAIPVIADASVEREFGTGAVKVTPAHDPNDFATARRHGLEFVTVMDTEGRMNAAAGEFAGMDRFACREAVVKRLEELGLLVRVEPYTNRVGACYRCATVVEPYLSEQWFVKMKALAEPAIAAAENGTLRFHPERWKKVYLQWLYDIQDWCISRQIWWGHRIPVWYCAAGCPPIAAAETPTACPHCGGTDLRQDEDVLDTWFSSWLWPFSVFGWPERSADLDRYYPTDTLVTAQEILFFWVARMVMSGFHFMGRSPFSDVYIHGTVRDKTGRKMSKSLGNVIDPLEIIGQYGADSLRFSLVSMTASGQDVFLSPSFYVKGRNFVNKIWNASRFIFMTADNAGVSAPAAGPSSPGLSEEWILDLLDETAAGVTADLEAFRFNDAVNRLYEFFWHRFCDWYLEIAKVRGADRATLENAVLPTLFQVLETSMRLLHPFIPFVTERVLGDLRRYRPGPAPCATAPWPAGGLRTPGGRKARMDRVIELVTAVRDIKTSFRVPLKTRVPVAYAGGAFSDEETAVIGALAGVERLETSPALPSGAAGTIARTLSGGRCAVSLAGIVDFAAERERCAREAEKLAAYLDGLRVKLARPDFVEKAPAELVEAERGRFAELEGKLARIREDMEFLDTKGA